MSRRSNAKREARKIVERLPAGASWDDIMYQFYVRQKFEEGVEAAERDEGMVHDQVKRVFRPK